ncbi:MAG: hypothetical protein A2X86_18275 [Bdellovibrionales bacterium GWA2_49_15]|nr:MAG: hypothetical protein A2X86_18275 [Bdellovibrionales bacterium GWA2_49_15]HAZ11671.1 hypothetical protein [Bdellovibrionales bacterium]
MGSLLFLERALLESLSTGAKSAREMSMDLNFSLPLVNSILFNMTKKNMVKFMGEKYLINRESLSHCLNEWNQPESLSWEAREILDGMVDHNPMNFPSETSFLKLRKIYFTDRDLALFKAQLVNLEKFLESLPAKPRRSEKTCDKTIFFWGMTNYKTVLKSILIR